MRTESIKNVLFASSHWGLSLLAAVSLSLSGCGRNQHVTASGEKPAETAKGDSESAPQQIAEAQTPAEPDFDELMRRYCARPEHPCRGEQGEQGVAGQNVTPDMVREAVTQFCQGDNNPCRGRDGNDATQEMVARGVADYCAGETHPCRGENGHDATPEMVATQVANYCEAHNGCRGERGDGPTTDQIAEAVARHCAGDNHPCRGERGQDVTTEMVARAVNEYCTQNEGCRGPQGQRGDNGAAATAEVVAQAIQNYCDHHPTNLGCAEATPAFVTRQVITALRDQSPANQEMLRELREILNTREVITNNNTVREVITNNNTTTTNNSETVTPAPAQPAPQQPAPTQACSRQEFRKTAELQTLSHETLNQIAGANGSELPYLLSAPNATGRLTVIGAGESNKRRGNATYVEDAAVIFELNIPYLPARSKLSAEGGLSANMVLKIEKRRGTGGRVNDDTEALCSMDLRKCSGARYHESTQGNWLNLLNGNAYEFVNQMFSQFITDVMGRVTGSTATVTRTMTKRLDQLFVASGQTMDRETFLNYVYGDATPDQALENRRLRFVVLDDTEVQEAKIEFQGQADVCEMSTEQRSQAGVREPAPAAAPASNGNRRNSANSNARRTTSAARPAAARRAAAQSTATPAAALRAVAPAAAAAPRQ